MVFTFIGISVVLYLIVYLVLTWKLDCDIYLAFCEKFGKSIDHLRGKVVFITGASSGIGEYTAKALAQNGVKLVLAARRKDELERVKQECIEGSMGSLKSGDVLVIPMDVLDTESHQKHFDCAVKHFGKVDVLFNNAGRSQRASWEKIDLKVHKEMFDLNLFSILSLTTVAVNYFQTRGEGHVAVMSSIAGVMGLPFSATYTGSKHALHGFFNCLRAEKVEQKISVTILCPGPVYTNFLQNCFTDKVGEKYGIAAKPTDHRMTPNRCGELCAIALANQASEAWMSVQPTMIYFMFTYFPNLYNFLIKTIGPKKFYNKYRDGKENIVKSD